MSNFDFRQLDDVIHSKIRLGIMTVLMSVDEASFSELKKMLHLSDGNLSLNIKKIEEAKFVKVSKEIVNNRPLTTYKITAKGKSAYSRYLSELEKIIKK